MFLELTRRRNPALIQAAVELHQNGKLEPDTYLLDLDVLLHNAGIMQAEADRFAINLFCMTKQFGRNPFIASQLIKQGFAGAVAVDFREAELLSSNRIQLGNVGHLVQIPRAKMRQTVACRPQFITVYSVDKAMEVDAAARDLGLRQPLLLRVIGGQDLLYPGQNGGFRLEELSNAAKAISRQANVRIAGVTSFPCLLFDAAKQDLAATPNLHTLLQAKSVLAAEEIAIEAVIAPSATCCGAMRKLVAFGVTHGEPGHGLIGSTPLHAAFDQPELPAMVYVSEISHSFGGKNYCFGGGHYRRSGMASALVGSRAESLNQVSVTSPELTSIDYHIELEKAGNTGDTVIFAFRSQVFVTRSRVAIAQGIQTGIPEIIGLYDSQGRKI